MRREGTYQQASSSSSFPPLLLLSPTSLITLHPSSSLPPPLCPPSTEVYTSPLPSPIPLCTTSSSTSIDTHLFFPSLSPHIHPMMWMEREKDKKRISILVPFQILFLPHVCLWYHSHSPSPLLPPLPSQPHPTEQWEGKSKRETNRFHDRKHLSLLSHC